MKVIVEVECTPEEARRFMGLPDVTPLNEALVAEMTKRMEKNVALMSPDTMLNAWTSVGLQAQDSFMKLMTSAASGALKGYGDKT